MKYVIQKSFRLVAFTLFLFVAAISNSGLAAQNVVFVLVDDLGWMDLSCQGSDYFKTPNIDRLAASGMRFTDAYAACAVCSPTRAAVMTGKWPSRVGVTDWIRARFQRGNVGEVTSNPTAYVGSARNKLLCPPNAYFLEHQEQTLAEVLKAERDVATAFVGKWHLGDPQWYPTSQGFDINIAGCDIGQPPSYFDPYKHPRYGFDGQLQPRQKGEFLTHREADEVVNFIKTHHSNHPEQPFFVHYCPYAVHTPIQAIESVANKYRRDGKTLKNAQYAAMVESVDDAVGSILQTLEELQLREDTLVIFTSDNGGLLGPTDNSPLRSGKGYAYEGGIRVPAIASWPGKIPPAKVSDLPISSVDFLPTVCDALGISPPADVDGVSLWPHLASGGKNRPDRQSLFWHFPHYRHAPGPYSIVRSGSWKLIRWYEGPTELYNLAEDLGETKDLAMEQPSKVSELQSLLEDFIKQTGSKEPRPNPNYSKK